MAAVWLQTLFDSSYFAFRWQKQPARRIGDDILYSNDNSNAGFFLAAAEMGRVIFPDNRVTEWTKESVVGWRISEIIFLSILLRLSSNIDPYRVTKWTKESFVGWRGSVIMFPSLLYHV